MRDRKRNRSLLPLLCLLALGSTPALGDDNTFYGQVEAVDVAGRRVQADGIVFALSSTATVEWTSGHRVGLRDIPLGTGVVVEAKRPESGPPVATRITLLPD